MNNHLCRSDNETSLYRTLNTHLEAQMVSSRIITGVDHSIFGLHSPSNKTNDGLMKLR